MDTFSCCRGAGMLPRRPLDFGQSGSVQYASWIGESTVMPVFDANQSQTILLQAILLQAILLQAILLQAILLQAILLKAILLKGTAA